MYKGDSAVIVTSVRQLDKLRELANCHGQYTGPGVDIYPGSVYIIEQATVRNRSTAILVKVSGHEYVIDENGSITS